MQIHLPPELEAFVQQLVKDGHFIAPDQAVETALWLLKDQYELYKVKRDELRKLIAVGIEQSEQGRVAPLDMDAIMARVAERLQQEQNKEVEACPK